MPVDKSSLFKAIESAESLINTEVNKMIRHEGSKWCVYSKDGSKNLGCYDTKKEAQKRLRQVEHFSKTDDEKIKKGLPADVLEGGIHLHGLERENAKTKTDGAHEHVFIVTRYIEYDENSPPEKEELFLVTNEDGIHKHLLEETTGDNTLLDGEHSHTLYMYEFDVDTYELKTIELETNEDGRHSHGLQVTTSSFDGLHTHTLDLENGDTVTSLTPGQVWDQLMGRRPQAGLPPLPPSSLFARLSDEQRAILNALLMIQDAEKCVECEDEITEEKSDEEPYKNSDFASGTIQALKLPNPEFIVKRLLLQQSAGILSKKNHKVRIDKAQALVNELSHLEFKDSFLWGIVSHSEAQQFKCLDDIPNELLESIDPIMRNEFNNEEDIYYLPISLIKSFDPPKKLNAPPKGRRFAGKIDLRENVVNVLKCSNCETPFEDIGRTGLSFCPRCLASSNTKVAKFMKPEREITIIKSEEISKEERYVFGVVLVPEETDAQGDIYNADEVRKAAHSFMELHNGNLKLMHRGEVLDGAAKVLETYVTKQEETHGDRTYPEGTWLLATRMIDDELWNDVKNGKFGGYSIGGSAIREAVA